VPALDLALGLWMARCAANMGHDKPKTLSWPI
jgi:hypothetical protein